MNDQEQQLVYELNSTEADRILWKTTAIKQGNEIAALKAQVNCLREELKMLNIGLGFSLCHADGVVKRSDIKKLINDIDKLLEATPEQCLSEVKAKAIEDAVELLSCQTITGNICYSRDLLDHAKELQEQAK